MLMTQPKLFDNGFGELSLGPGAKKFSLPEKIKTLQNICSIAGAENSSIFLDNLGNIFTCGNNVYGQLGHGDTQQRNIAEKVQNIPPIAALASASWTETFFVIVDCDGGVWGCGKNDAGQLGLGDTINRHEFTRIEGLPEMTRGGVARFMRTKSANNRAGIEHCIAKI